MRAVPNSNNFYLGLYHWSSYSIYQNGKISSMESPEALQQCYNNKIHWWKCISRHFEGIWNNIWTYNNANPSVVHYPMYCGVSPKKFHPWTLHLGLCYVLDPCWFDLHDWNMSGLSTECTQRLPKVLYHKLSWHTCHGTCWRVGLRLEWVGRKRLRSEMDLASTYVLRLALRWVLILEAKDFGVSEGILRQRWKTLEGLRGGYRFGGKL